MALTKNPCLATFWWFCDAGSHLVFSLLCAYQACITRNMTHRSNVFDFNLKGHEIFLLVTCGGTFCFHLLRIITAIILLSVSSDLDKNVVDMCAIGMVNSILSMTVVWQMTALST